MLPISSDYQIEAACDRMVVTPEGLPLAYEVMPGNTRDNTTLRGFLERIERQYGKAQRVWLMDRGIPTEEVLAEMRACDPPVQYLVGTPEGTTDPPGEGAARHALAGGAAGGRGEASAAGRRALCLRPKPRSRRQGAGDTPAPLKWLWKRLAEIAAMKLTREELLMTLGGARANAPAAWRLIGVVVAADSATFSFTLDRKKLRQARRREGRYLLRTNLTDADPARLWSYYLQLVAVEEALPARHARTAPARTRPASLRAA